MKKTITSILFSLFFVNLIAQCNLNMTVSVDATGNIVTTNNSIGADPSSYHWYAYNLTLNPWIAEHHETSNTMSYAPLNIGNYLICLIATESGTNNACDSICEPLTYSQSMMNMQNTSGIDELFDKKDIIIYPNPSKGILNIIDSEITNANEFEIVDLIGNQYNVACLINNSSIEIEVSSLPKGIYFIVLTKTKQTLKFIVN